MMNNAEGILMVIGELRAMADINEKELKLLKEDNNALVSEVGRLQKLLISNDLNNKLAQEEKDERL